MTIAEHVDSLAVTGELPGARIVLLDDLVTKGTQAAACVMVLRAAGFTGMVQGYFVSHTLHPNRQGRHWWFAQVHKVEWFDGQEYARNWGTGQWKRGSPDDA